MTVADINLLKEQGLTHAEIAERLGISIATVYRHLWQPGPPPDPHPDFYRNRILQCVYQVRCDYRVSWITAARIVVEETDPQTLARSSLGKRPVTPERLARWCRPKK